jgi:DNA adenine methylase
MTVNVHGAWNLDPTALQRQKRRINRLKASGVGRATVFVHDECKAALDRLRPHLLDPRKANALVALVSQLDDLTTRSTIAHGPRFSLFRYPGGKSWLVPEVRKWLVSSTIRPSIFVEPFGGGAIAGLTVAAEGLVDKVLLSEIDAGVSAVWRTIFRGREDDVAWLCQRIGDFVVSLENVRTVLDAPTRNLREAAFKTILRNRMQRGGVMAPGAGLLKLGEDRKGLASRWYPETLIKRIEALRGIRGRIKFERADAFEILRRHADDPGAYFFVDPPYTAGGRNAGRRLYENSEIDHQILFSQMASVRGSFMMTYDDVPAVRGMALEHGFRLSTVQMKTTHHKVINELLICKP